jgi:arsenate reductase
MKAKIYHNPRCSKSRATLALLESRGVNVEIVDYLKSPPSANEIHELLARLEMRAADIVRASESAFVESGLDLDSRDADLIELMTKSPIVIQRPIVVVGDAARIGRPPEQVLELLA